MTVDHKFSDTLNGLLTRIFREGISAMHSPKAAEAMRKSTDELAKDIETKIRATTTELLKKLQAGVVRGFNLLEADHKKLEARIAALEDRTPKTVPAMGSVAYNRDGSSVQDHE